MRYRITHETTYVYRDPVSLCQNVAHLRPRTDIRQNTSDFEMNVSPRPAVIEEKLDYFGNPVAYFTIQEQHKELKIRVTNRVDLSPVSSLPLTTSPWEEVRDRLESDRSNDWLDAYQFAFASRFVPLDEKYASYASQSFAPGRPIHEAALDLTRRIFTDFAYDPKATTIATPVAEVFQKRRGVCQDFAHVQLACMRSLGLAARYVSGYLSTIPPPGKPRLVGADASHAWVSLFCGDAGWIDFDPTNNQMPADRHILTAWGRDYGDVSPLKGVILGGGPHDVRVSVDVLPEAICDPSGTQMQ